ncbi:MAG: FkbM family methyltransferase [Verrucomicrobiae bacterium]|nr:FkbM family methyltransferase [Verrucomicrobiae bacterium]
MIQSLLRKSVALVPWRWRTAIKRVPLVAPLQRWLLARFLEKREFVHTVDAGPARGLRYPITLPDDKGIWTGTYESDLATRVAAATRRDEPALDIGGWRGFFGGVMALAGASRVHIFEPMPANCAQIRRMIELNPVLPIELVEAAVSDAEGSLEFVLMPESSMGKLTTSSFQQENQSGRRIQVRTVSLDALLAAGRIQPPSVIKIDVEGAELLVLRGALNLLATHRPTLFMETHSTELARDCRALLEQTGYDVRVLERNVRDICHFHAQPKSSGEEGSR